MTLTHGAGPVERVRTTNVSALHGVHLISAVAGSLALTWMVYERLLPVHGAVGFVIVWYVAFLVLYAVVSATELDPVGVVDRVVGALVATAGLVLVGILIGIVFFTAARGSDALGHLNFFTQTTALTGPDAGLDKGGILAAIVGTLEQVAISVLISVPLGIATAVYLSEVGGRLARVVRTVVQAMSAIPTIVSGLFIYAMLIIGIPIPHWIPWVGTELQLPRSGFAAALALCVNMIPVVVTTAEVMLRLVPNGLREASLALGTSQWQVIRGVVLPTARPGLVTAVLLGVARVIGETSPVLLVAGSTNEMNLDPLHEPQVSLPLFVFNQARLPLDVAIERAFGAGVVLLALVVVFFALARFFAGRPVGHVSARKQRRLSRRYAQDIAASTEGKVL